MRKHILLLLILCLHFAARGQTIVSLEDIDLSGLPQPTQAKALRYWFDDDAGSVQTVGQLAGKYTLDVSSLLNGLHTVHYQVIDEEDAVAGVRSSVFLKIGLQESSTTAKALRYWFDDDAGSVQTVNGFSNTYTLDVSSLMDGMHTLHYQIIDNSNVAAYARSSVFLKISKRADASTLQTLRYWFDDDAASAHVVSNANGVQTLDASSLMDGLHTLHYQAIGSDGAACYVASGIFMKVGSSMEAASVKPSKLMYWFDDATEIQYVDISEGSQLLDASSLMEGLHTVHYQVLCNNGTMTSAMSSVFLRVNADAEAAVAKSLRYWFDDETAVTVIEVSNGIQILDASRLLDGLHTVHYQIADDKGTLGAPASSVFLKMNEQSAASAAKSVRYWFDDDASSVKVTDVANGTQTLDMSHLLTGLHTLNYQLIDSDGKVGAPVVRIFLKNFDKVIEGGTNRITKYDYWMNKDSQKMQTVAVSNAPNPYTLIGLLPMQKAPIQSSLFHFEVTEGTPTIYAKNIFHIRFHDAQGYFTDNYKPFIDYSVSKIVEPVGELQPTQTFERVAENDIRWYTVDLEPGDTLAFRLSQPATLQLYSPSGKEVFNTSEAASIKWNGIHSWENGIYYLAVHDVTGTRSTMTLDYMHMDKYDVVDWDVHRVGNGGCSTITFKGNGFRDLYRVDLYNAVGDTIRSVDVGHESDATTSVTFDFTDAELGVYDAVFRFTQEDKKFANIVTVEEARDIELATNISFPSHFSRSATYTVKITNKGNMTAYAVPIYTWIKSLTKDGIYHIEYEGLSLGSVFDGIETDSLTESEIAELKSYAASCGDDHHFLKFWAEDETNLGDSVCIRSNYFFTSIAPYETKTLRLTIYTKEVDTYAYFTVPEDWPSYSLEQLQNEPNYTKVQFKSPKQQSQYCCISDKIDCVLSTAAFWLDMGSAVSFVFGPEVAGIINAADCSVSVAAAINKTSKIIACGDDWSEDDMRGMIGNAAKSAISAAISCVAAKFSKLGNLRYLKEHSRYSNLGNGLSALVAYVDRMHPSDGDFSCFKEWTKPIPGCPPCTTCPGGGGSGGGKSHDPNDIEGYLSEAGSKFIADSVAKVNYTIEFENDTAFATASAHTIVIRDTLDNRYFDLSTFAPTSVRIGERTEFLDGEPNFVKTIDMRPEINAIAQVTGEYDQKKGIATWTLQSLDPMTMEPTDDLMQGILPVNYNGTSGIGEVGFEIGVKSGKADGTEIPNRAGIVFDYEEAILTPTWTNIVDAVRPTSRVVDGTINSDSTIVLQLHGEDNRSGIWKYDVYAQQGQDAPWVQVAANVTDSLCEVPFYKDIEYGFCVLATDSAGNVERKELTRELAITAYVRGDVNDDGRVNIADVTALVNIILGKQQYYVAKVADVNGDGRVNIADVTALVNIILGK